MKQILSIPSPDSAYGSQIPTTYSSQKRTAPQPPTQWSEQEPDPSSIYNIEDLRSHSRSLLSGHRRSGKRSPRGPDRTFSLLFLFHSPVPVSPWIPHSPGCFSVSQFFLYDHFSFYFSGSLSAVFPALFSKELVDTYKFYAYAENLSRKL